MKTYKLPTPPELTQLPWTHSEYQAISNYVYFSDADMLKQHLGIDLHLFERCRKLVLDRVVEKKRIANKVRRLARLQYLIQGAIFVAAAMYIYLTR